MTDDELAKDTGEKIRIDDPRVFFASERTLLAWIRTSIAMMGLGFLVARFGLFVREMMLMRGDETARTSPISLAIGVSMVCLGVLMAVTAAYEHYAFLKRLELERVASGTRRVMSVAIAMLLALVGAAMALYLLAVR